MDALVSAQYKKKEHLFRQIGIVGKLRKQLSEHVVVHEQRCRWEAQRSSDYGEAVNGDCAPALLVMDECVAWPVESGSQFSLREAGCAAYGGDSPANRAIEGITMTAHRSPGTEAARRLALRQSAFYT